MKRKSKKARKLQKVIFFMSMNVLVIVALFRIGVFTLPSIEDKLQTAKDYAKKIATTDMTTNTKIQNDSSKSFEIKMKGVYSHNGILVCLKEKKELWSLREEEKIYPASMTKIMSVLVAMENISDLESIIELPEDMFPALYKENASMAGFLPGEEVLAMDLLYGAMLPSGADATLGLARNVAGSEDAFVELMNQKAQQLGMYHTHFSNACGLYQKDHYSTVKDIAILLEYALKNQQFREIFSAVRYSTSKTNLHPNGITFYSTLFANIESAEIDGGRMVGGKTGYTQEAGLCLASLAEKNGTEYILITADAKGNHKTKQYHIMDAKNIYKSLWKQTVD